MKNFLKLKSYALYATFGHIGQMNHIQAPMELVI